MSSTPTSLSVRMSSGVSPQKDAVAAIEQACELCATGLGSVGLARAPVDLAVVFLSKHHAEQAPEIAERAQRLLDPACLIGVTASAVIGGPLELEGMPGISMLAARLPGIAVHPFTTDDLPVIEEGAVTLEKLGDGAGFGPESALTLMLVDPFSVPMVHLMPALHRARMARHAPGPIFGGLASASGTPGGNALILGDRVEATGLVGVTLQDRMGGRLGVETVVSQGCRPFGPAMVVTKAKGNMIFELGGRPAIDAIQEAVADMPEEEREALRQGLFIGKAVSEYKGRFGRDDFLIRNVVNVAPELGAVAVADAIRVGTTVRLHARDATTAREDLGMLLDVQRLHGRPRGALLITCNGRGRRLFGDRHHDSQAVVRAFAPMDAGEQRAKPGVRYDPSNADVIPLAGFFAAGEIGPLGGQSYVHGQTACVALFRDAPSERATMEGAAATERVVATEDEATANPSREGPQRGEQSTGAS